jgi:hypothetical protein
MLNVRHDSIFPIFFPSGIPRY